MKPTIGRIVHYVEGSGAHRAALITAVHSDKCVNLTVFYSDGIGFFPSVMLVDPALDNAPKTWHWPERE